MRVSLFSILAFVIVQGVGIVTGQESTNTTQTVSVPAVEPVKPSQLVVDLTALKSELEAIEVLLKGLELSADKKTQSENQVKEAKSNISGIESNLQIINNYRTAIENYSSTKEKLESDIKALKAKTQPAKTESENTTTNTTAQVPVNGQPAPNNADPAQLENNITSARSRLSALNAELKVLNDNYSSGANRPSEIQMELSNLKTQIAESSTNQKPPAIPGDTNTENPVLGRLSKLQSDAKSSFLVSQEQKLTEELNSHAQRYELTRLRREFKSLEVKNVQQNIEKLDSQLKLARQAEARRIESEANQASQNINVEHPYVQAFIESNKTYASANSKLVEQLTSYESLIQENETEMDALSKELESFKREVEVGGTENIITEVLLDSLQRAERRIQKGFGKDAAQDELKESRRKRFKYERRISELESSDVEDAVPENPEKSDEDGQGPVPDLTDNDREKLLELKQQQLELLQKLESTERKTAIAIAKSISVQDQYLTLLKEHVSFINSNLMWVPTSRPLWQIIESVQTFKSEFSGLRQRAFIALDRVLNQKAFIELGTLLLIYFVMMWYLLRNSSALMSRLKSNAGKVRKISTDGFRYTLETMGICFLLPFRTSLIFIFLSLWLFWHFEVLSIGGGVASGFLFVWGTIHWNNFIRLMGGDQSLFEGHFRWRDPFYKPTIRALTWFVPSFAVFGFFVVFIDVSGEAYLRELAFAPGAIFMVILAWGYYMRACGKSGENVRRFFKETEVNWLTRFSGFWVFLGYALLVLLLFLAIFGYQYAAFNIGSKVLSTVLYGAAGFLGYFAGIRWFLVKERKVALEQALERRKAQSPDQTHPAGADSELGIPVEESDDFNLSHVKDHTRGFLKSLFSLYALFGMWFIWLDVIPALQFFEEVRLWTYTVTVEGQLDTKWISLFDIFILIAVIVLTTTAARNIPGVIEIILLERLPLHAGVRYALRTVFQYIVVAIGILLVFKSLGFKFSQFSWILAALSFGLGFGLQEVVANFVCGILLLIERPIRVGDVVTVGDTTGVISKIQIRATTVMDWDRKEYIVPNKEFITGKILNWTLTNKLNRVVVKVGVAYGTDVKKSVDVILGVLKEMPDILADPQPVVTFDAFADSSLNLTVRFFLANLDRRLANINEVHHRIHERFMEEGIEIPFPQRVVTMVNGKGKEPHPIDEEGFKNVPDEIQD